MKRLLIAAIALPLIFGLGPSVTANDAHHPEKQAKSKAPAKQPAKKQVKQVPAKKDPR